MTPVTRAIVNAGAGSMQDDAARTRLQDQLTRALPDIVILWCDAEHPVDEMIAQAMRSSPTLLIACGGDGTINVVATAVVGTEIVLGVLPGGTLNHFAKDLGIPTDLEQAVLVLAHGTPRLVDVGTVNDHIFLNNAGLGLYPEIVRRREAHQRRGIAKWPAATISAIRALLRYRELGIRLRTRTTTLLRRTPALFVGNNEYSNHDSLKPSRDSLTSGKLSVFIPRARGRMQLLWFTLRALVGNVRDDAGFELLLLERFTTEAKHSLAHVSIDGEVVKLHTPLEFASRPGALRVMAPVAAEVPADATGDTHTTTSG